MLAFHSSLRGPVAHDGTCQTLHCTSGCPPEPLHPFTLSPLCAPLVKGGQHGGSPLTAAFAMRDMRCVLASAIARAACSLVGASEGGAGAAERGWTAGGCAWVWLCQGYPWVRVRALRGATDRRTWGGCAACTASPGTASKPPPLPLQITSPHNSTHPRAAPLPTCAHRPAAGPAPRPPPCRAPTPETLRAWAAAAAGRVGGGDGGPHA